eukprot:COSAG06_NODE_4259_length_4424_cov_10.139653_3_plen_75_part_00
MWGGTCREMAKEDVDEPSLPLPMEHQLQYGAKRKGKWCVLQHAWIVLHKLSHDVCPPLPAAMLVDHDRIISDLL